MFFALGYVFGFSWSRARKGDFLSGVLFIMFGNMLLFLFANNTYLSSVFYSFMFLLPFWIVTRVLPFLPAAAIRATSGARSGTSFDGSQSEARCCDDSSGSESAYVDDGCQIGDGTKVWHFSHIHKGATVGRNCVFGQNVNVANDVVIGDGVRYGTMCRSTPGPSSRTTSSSGHRAC